MTLHLERAGYVVECDDCGDTLETETRDFSEMRESMRGFSWLASRDPKTEQWSHHCVACRNRR